ncbi:MAG: TIGR03089 family protein, partial [Mycolicibacterium sp.]|nr:TIGR03089 family protein [Mycolicibacterium sp.]
ALCTADRLDEADAAAGMGSGIGEVVALSLDPFGKPVPGLPIGVTDYATSVRVHGDQIVPERAPGAALNGRSAADLLALAADSASEQELTDSDRVLSTATWDTDDDLIRHFLAVLSAGASLVQVTNPDPGALERRRVMEKVSRG